MSPTSGHCNSPSQFQQRYPKPITARIPQANFSKDTPSQFQHGYPKPISARKKMCLRQNACLTVPVSSFRSWLLVPFEFVNELSRPLRQNSKGTMSHDLKGCLHTTGYCVINQDHCNAQAYPQQGQGMCMRSDACLTVPSLLFQHAAYGSLRTLHFTVSVKVTRQHSKRLEGYHEP